MPDSRHAPPHGGDTMPGSIVLQLDPGPGNSRNSEGDFIELASGRLLFVYTRYQDDSDDAGHAVLASRYSDDGGRTWSSDDRVVVEQEGNLNVMSVTLLRLQDGRIALFYLRKDEGELALEGVTYPMMVCMPMVRFSDDEAETFSPAQPMAGHPAIYVVNNDRVIQLANGRLVAPAGRHAMRGKVTQEDGRAKPTWEMPQASLALFLISDDGGATWREGEDRLYNSPPVGPGLQEPGVIELQDGRLWAWARPALQLDEKREWWRQYQACSDDRGETWTALEPSDFVSPRSPLSMKRLASGSLLAVWNDVSGRFNLPEPTAKSWGRTPLVTAISDDDGRTWRNHTLIEDSPSHGYCYTAIHVMDDAVLLAYCAGGESSQLVLDTLRMRRIGLDELGA